MEKGEASLAGQSLFAQLALVDMLYIISGQLVQIAIQLEDIQTKPHDTGKKK